LVLVPACKRIHRAIWDESDGKNSLGGLARKFLA
jgi:hypothetical protein